MMEQSHQTTVKNRQYPFATTARIAAQLKGDPRAIALILAVPPLLLTLLYYVFHDVPVPPGQPHVFDTTGPIMLAVLPMFMMFIVTSVIMLRERASGTLERILTTPLTRWNLLASYALWSSACWLSYRAVSSSSCCLVPWALSSRVLPGRCSCWPSSTRSSGLLSGCWPQPSLGLSSRQCSSYRSSSRLRCFSVACSSRRSNSQTYWRP